MGKGCLAAKRRDGVTIHSSGDKPPGAFGSYSSNNSQRLTWSSGPGPIRSAITVCVRTPFTIQPVMRQNELGVQEIGCGRRDQI